MFQNNLNPENKSQQEILDEMENKILDNLHGKGLKNIIFYSKFNRLRKHFIRIFIISVVLFFTMMIFSAITAPPRYSDTETEKNIVKLEQLISAKADSISPLFESALVLLEKYPKYYKKVVNNIHNIEIRGGVCPYACIYSKSYITAHGMTDYIRKTLIPDANFAKKTLIINPKGIRHYNTDIKFASMLIHETDHVEYIESGKLRRAALFVKCNPLLNPHISINSTLPSISHRVKTIEICAEKEQIKFHKLTNTRSGYEASNGIISIFFQSALALFSGMFSFIKSLFGF